MQVNTAMLLKNLPPHVRNMIVKGGRSMPIHAAAAAAAQAGRQPPAASSPKVSPLHAFSSLCTAMKSLAYSASPSLPPLT